VVACKPLSAYDSTRENNFTLLRLVFAIAVLLGHSFPITGTGFDPLSSRLLPYTWIGGIAVNGFFVISGYLITKSFVTQDPVYFVVSRVARLYPAVIVYLLLTVVVVGPYASSVPLDQYFEANPWNNFWNGTLWEWKHNLPYVFGSNPIPNVTNGSGWTLPVELRCYLLILAIGLIGLLRNQFIATATLLGAVVATPYFGVIEALGLVKHAEIHVIAFLVGSLAWINRRFIPLNPLAAVLFSIAPFMTTSSTMNGYIQVISIAYVVLYFSFMAKTINMDRFGDISYGVYIYAYPVQQLVWWPGQSGSMNAVVAMGIVLPIAYLSWVYVERPALEFRKKRFVADPHCRTVVGPWQWPEARRH
jgi:peptidoglycan/LPS O-acetylase OafA/YrhL